MKKFAVSFIISLLLGNVAFAEIKNADTQHVKYQTGNYDFTTNSTKSMEYSTTN